MNPQSASIPAPAQSQNPAAPTMVTNIPVHNPTAVNDETDLDKIMSDVGQELKKEDIKPQKHHFFNIGHHTENAPSSAHQPVQPAPTPLPQPMMPTSAVQVTRAAQPAPIVERVPATAEAAKTTPQRSIPAFVIFTALVVTSFLIVAAIAAFRQT